MNHTAILKRVYSAAGNKNKLALALGLTRQAIGRWREVPLRRVLDVERVTGIPREELRPDFHGRKRNGR